MKHEEDLDKMVVSQSVKNLTSRMADFPDEFSVNIEFGGWYRVNDTKNGINGSLLFSSSNSFGIVEAYAVGDYSFMNYAEIKETFQAAKALSKYKVTQMDESAKTRFEDAYKQV